MSPENSGDELAPLFRGDPRAIRALRLDLGATGQHRADLRRALYADVDVDVDEETAEAAMAMLTPDFPVTLITDSTVLTEHAWGSVRRTYVLSRQDLAVRPALQRRLISEADAAHPRHPTAVVELDTSHSPFLSQPDAVAHAIAHAR